MIVDIHKILQAVGERETVTFEQTFDEELADDFQLLQPIHGMATLANSGLGIIVTGEMMFEATHICGVCLKKYKTSGTIPFDERFVDDVAKDDIGLKEEKELKGDDIFYTYSDYKINLAEMLREQLILSLPIAPKCDINCTVKNSNKEKTIDPRLKILEQLKGGE